jgi:dihydroorotase
MGCGWQLACLVGLAVTPPPTAFDLLLKGGHVLDPRNHRHAILDVAVADGKVVRVAADLPVERARKVIPVHGLYVVPGLVDLHVHVYAATGSIDTYAGDRSVYPDGHTFRSGVTTVVDAGTSGHRNFLDFKRRVIDRSKTRVLALVNLVGGGMGDRPSQQKRDDMDPRATAALAKRFPQVVVGIKTAHYDGPEWLAVDRAVEAGELAGLPVMVDFGTFRPERQFQQLVLEKMRPGDIYTHLYLGNVPLFDGNGVLLPYLAKARQRGVKFDLGHGKDSFLWRQAVPAVRQGWLPDTLSTDLHVDSMNAGMKDLSNILSKFLSLDVPLADVIRMATWNPAQIIHRPDLGHLGEGAAADVAVFRLCTGEFGFLDARNFRRQGKQKLECELTLREGRIVWDLNGRAGEEWIDPAKVRVPPTTREPSGFR